MDANKIFERVSELVNELIKKNDKGICGTSGWKLDFACKKDVIVMNFTGVNSDKSGTVKVSGDLVCKTWADQSKKYVCTMSPWTFTLHKFKDFEIKKVTSFVEFDDLLDNVLQKVVKRVVLMGCDYMHSHLCHRCSVTDYPPKVMKFKDHVGFDGKVARNFFTCDAGEGAAGGTGKRSAEELLNENDRLKKQLRRQQFDFDEKKAILATRLEKVIEENKSLKAQVESSDHTHQSAGQLLVEFNRLRQENAKKDAELARLREAQDGYTKVLAENCGMKRRLAELTGRPC